MMGAVAAADPRTMGLSTLHNFVLMCVAFAFNHGSVASVLNISVTLLGNNGSFMNGTLYIMYALTALLFATAPLDLLGSRKSLLVGATTYSIYVFAFPVSLVIPPDHPTLELLVALAGGLVGGFAAGFIWVAQGKYFSSAAKQYAAEQGIEESQANQTFASIFAFTLLSVEVLLKLFPVALLPVSHDEIVVYPGKTLSLSNLIIAIAYSATALGAVVLMRFIADVDVEETGTAADPLLVASHKKFTVDKALAAVRLMWTQPTVLLLAPIQVTFGMCAALIGEEVTGTIIHDTFGADAVIVGSLLGTLVSFTAGALQVPTKLLRARVGRVPLMLFGLLAFVAETTLILLLSPAQIGMWAALVPIYLLQGMGRSCYEGANKALYADMFPRDAAAAFSSIVIFNGGASAATYFAFPLLQDDPHRKSIKAIAALVPAVLTVFSYLGAEGLHERLPAGPHSIS